MPGDMDPLLVRAVLGLCAGTVAFLSALAAWGAVRFVQHVDRLGETVGRLADDVARVEVRLATVEGERAHRFFHPGGARAPGSHFAEGV